MTSVYYFVQTATGKFITIKPKVEGSNPSCPTIFWNERDTGSTPVLAGPARVMAQGDSLNGRKCSCFKKLLDNEIFKV